MKIFYVGMQRCGTKSFGELFKTNGFRVCSWPEIEKFDFVEKVINGKWLDVLNSEIFDEFDVFEDGPFMLPEFAIFLSNYVENSKFAYFHRPPDDWYKSMVTHSNGLTLGDVGRHCYLYDRLDDLHFIRSQNVKKIKKLSLVGMKDHYTKCYEIHKHQIQFLFSKISPDRFYVDELYNKDKFENMNEHFGLDLENTNDVHAHKSTHEFGEIVRSHSYLF